MKDKNELQAKYLWTCELNKQLKTRRRHLTQILQMKEFKANAWRHQKVHLDQENKNLRQHVTELEAMNKARRVVHFGQDYKPRSLVQTCFMDL